MLNGRYCAKLCFEKKVVNVLMTLVLPSDDIQFTANIFYILLLDAVDNKYETGKGPHINKGKHTQTEMYCDLNVLTDPSCTTSDAIKQGWGSNKGNSFAKSLQTYASKFYYGKINCKKSGQYLLNHESIKSTFDHQVKCDHKQALKKTVEFARKYFGSAESSQKTALVQKALCLILNDKTIDEPDEFYVGSDGSSKTKSDLRTATKIEFEAFLLGVWHYLIVKRRIPPVTNFKFETDDTITFNPEYKQIPVSLTYSDMEIELEKPPVPESKTNADSDMTNDISDTDNEPDDIPDTAESGPHGNGNPEFLKRIRNSANRPSKSKAPSFEGEDPLTIDEIIDYYPSEIDANTDIISVLENSDIALSPSIFFYLLVENIEMVHPKRNKHAAEHLFLDLLDMTVDNSCKIDFSRSCVQDKYDKFRYLKALCAADCLDDIEQVQLLGAIKERSAYLRDMIKIRKKYFNSDSRNTALVVELIEFIRNDDSIPDNQEFKIASDQTVTKEQLFDVEEIEFEPFLLDVWFYVIRWHNADKITDERTFNTVFKLTYENNGKHCERYRNGDIISDQSELYIELSYLDE